MSGSRVVQAVVCLVLGVAVGIASIFVLAHTAAIAAPEGFFAWFKQAGSIEAGVFSWDLLVTYGLGVGLPAFIVALLALRFVVAATAGSALAFAAGVLLAIHGLAPLWFGTPLDTVSQRPWFYYALEASLGLATWAAWWIARRWQRSSADARPPTVVRDTT